MSGHDGKAGVCRVVMVRGSVKTQQTTTDQEMTMGEDKATEKSNVGLLAPGERESRVVQYCTTRKETSQSVQHVALTTTSRWF
jgi:hypothetical protein